MRKFLKTQFVGITKFQGSNDGTTFTDIFTFGDEVHEGWNYYKYDSGSELKYRHYRFYGSTSNSCIIGEIGFKGIEVIDSSATSYSSCPIELILNGASPITLSGSITYSVTKTAKVTSISPRYGKV